MIGVLQIFCAAEVVVVAVGENQVFHLAGIEAQFLIAFDDDALRIGRVVQAVDLNDAGAGDDRPRGDALTSQIVELVKNLGGRSIDDRAQKALEKGLASAVTTKSSRTPSPACVDAQTPTTSGEGWQARCR